MLTNSEDAPAARVHADRAAGGDRDHRHPHRPAAAGGQKVREAANRIKCANNLKQLGLAAHHYHDANQHLPPGIGYYPTATNGAFGTYFFHLLPYLEQDNLYRSCPRHRGIPAAGRTERRCITRATTPSTASRWRSSFALRTRASVRAAS